VVFFLKKKILPLVLWKISCFIYSIIERRTCLL